MIKIKIKSNVKSHVQYGNLMFAIQKCFNTYIIMQSCVSQTQQNFIMFIIVLRQHVSIVVLQKTHAFYT